MIVHMGIKASEFQRVLDLVFLLREAEAKGIERETIINQLQVELTGKQEALARMHGDCSKRFNELSAEYQKRIAELERESELRRVGLENIETLASDRMMINTVVPQENQQSWMKVHAIAAPLTCPF